MPPFEPALEEDLSDAHLANLLAADARAASKRYSSQGLAALLGSKVSSAPKAKPNTRFLKNLVKNTDSHNDRLKRKEEAERREKLRKLEEQDEERRRAERKARGPGPLDEEGRARKRRKTEDARTDAHRRRYERRNSSSEFSEPEVRPRSTSPNPPKSVRKQRQSRKDDASDSDDKDRRKSHSHRKHKRRRSRSPNSLRLTPETHRTPPDNEESSSHRATIKPATPPPTSSKGRLSNKLATPILDDDEDDDWHNALSALRDRENYARIQASRLLAAGLPSSDVKKWNSSVTNGLPPEGKIEDVKWKGKGEEREWDKGKPTLGFDDEESHGEEKADAKKQAKESTAQKRRTGEGWKKSGGLLRGFKDALGK